MATFQTGLEARGPGLLLRDIRKGDAPRIEAAMAMIVAVNPDIAVLQGIDYDAGGATLGALADRLSARGAAYPYRFALRPNTGMATGRDMDGDGRLGRARDAQGYGRFAGQGGMAILSRHPIATRDVVAFTGMLWRDLPGHTMPDLPAGVAAIQRLSTTAHWVVPVDLDGRRIHLLTWYATPPVFDGPEDRNGRRNHDEAALWLRYLEGKLARPPPGGPLILAGAANLDPADGDGRPGALLRLLDHPRLTDPRPTSVGGAAAADPGHRGDPARDTADWADDPGNLRVDYLLPSRDWRVVDSGVFWPAPGTEAAVALGPPEAWPAHRMVWADLVLP